MRDHAKVAAALLLQERGYADSEINHGLSFYKDGIKFTKSSIMSLTNGAEDFIKLQHDSHYVGTSFYRGLAYFWARKYRFCMRGDVLCHGDGYKGKSIQQIRRTVHQKFLDEGLALDGETQRHDEIINAAFVGYSNYTQDEVAA
jgi:hypothetical protein